MQFFLGGGGRDETVCKLLVGHKLDSTGLSTASLICKLATIYLSSGRETETKLLNRERSVLFACEVQKKKKKELEEDIKWKQKGRIVCLQEHERCAYICECFLKGDQTSFFSNC